MTRMQKQLQRRALSQMARTAVLQGTALALIVVLAAAGWLLPGTAAFFTDRAETQATFRAVSAEDLISITPGKSKTNDSPGDPGPAFLVASGGRLNFGTYPAGNNRNFPHVLTVTNISNRTFDIHWGFSGPIAALIESGGAGSLSLSPGESIELGFKLDTDPGQDPGEYTGTFHLTGLHSWINTAMPAVLRMAAPPPRRQKGQGQAQGKDGKADAASDGAEDNVAGEDQDNGEGQADDGDESGDEGDADAEGDKDEDKPVKPTPPGGGG